jgi:hypothetical protein
VKIAVKPPNIVIVNSIMFENSNMKDDRTIKKTPAVLNCYIFY